MHGSNSRISNEQRVSLETTRRCEHQGTFSTLTRTEAAKAFQIKYASICASSSLTLQPLDIMSGVSSLIFKTASTYRCLGLPS